MSDAVATTITAVTDFDSADDFVKKHTPYLTSQAEGEKTRVFVEVGHEVPHPNGPDHFIQWVELMVGEAPIARFTFAAAVAYPNASVLVDLPAGTRVRAVGSCNLHGLFTYEIGL